MGKPSATRQGHLGQAVELPTGKPSATRLRASRQSVKGEPSATRWRAIRLRASRWLGRAVNPYQASRQRASRQHKPKPCQRASR
jgi:hypothetical protein